MILHRLFSQPDKDLGSSYSEPGTVVLQLKVPTVFLLRHATASGWFFLELYVYLQTLAVLLSRVWLAASASFLPSTSLS